MWRALCFGALLALLLPVLGTAGTRAPGDGTLSVRDLEGQKGVLSLQARGAVVGRCDSCTFRLVDLRDDNTAVPIVAGAERSRDLDLDGDRDWWSGTNIHWKLIGTTFWLQIHRGRDIDLSIVGRGQAPGRIKGFFGTYSLNGEEYEFVLPEWTTFRLAAPVLPTTPAGG
jgi:hypothetical protein